MDEKKTVEPRDQGPEEFSETVETMIRSHLHLAQIFERLNEDTSRIQKVLEDHDEDRPGETYPGAVERLIQERDRARKDRKKSGKYSTERIKALNRRIKEAESFANRASEDALARLRQAQDLEDKVRGLEEERDKAQSILAEIDQRTTGLSTSTTLLGRVKSLEGQLLIAKGENATLRSSVGEGILRHEVSELASLRILVRKYQEIYRRIDEATRGQSEISPLAERVEELEESLARVEGERDEADEALTTTRRLLDEARRDRDSARARVREVHEVISDRFPNADPEGNPAKRLRKALRWIKLG